MTYGHDPLGVEEHVLDIRNPFTMNDPELEMILARDLLSCYEPSDAGMLDKVRALENDLEKIVAKWRRSHGEGVPGQLAPPTRGFVVYLP